MSGRQAVAVVLAAGAGSRYEGATHKLLAPLRGRTVVTWALEHALAAGLDQTWVVTGAVDLKASVVPPGIEVLVNDRWREGQATSLQVAVGAARAASHEIQCLVVGLGDQPFLSPETWRAVARSQGRPVAVATYRGQRRNPVRLDRPCWDLLPIAGDEGARTLMRARPDLVMEVDVTGTPVDIDTVADLDQAEGAGPSL